MQELHLLLGTVVGIVDKAGMPLLKSRKAGKAAWDVSLIKVSQWLHVAMVQHVCCCFLPLASSFFKRYVGCVVAVFLKEVKEEVIVGATEQGVTDQQDVCRCMCALKFVRTGARTMFREKIAGPRMDPWGIPHELPATEDEELPKVTEQGCKKWNQCKAVPLIPTLWIWFKQYQRLQGPEDIRQCLPLVSGVNDVRLNRARYLIDGGFASVTSFWQRYMKYNLNFLCH